MGVGEYASSDSLFPPLVPKSQAAAAGQNEQRGAMCFDLWTLTLYQTLKLQSAGGPPQVIVNMWETHQQPRTMNPTGIEQQGWWLGLGKKRVPYSNPSPAPPTSHHRHDLATNVQNRTQFVFVNQIFFLFFSLSERLSAITGKVSCLMVW